MTCEPTSTTRTRHLRERRARGVVMVEVDERGVVLLKRHQAEGSIFAAKPV